MRTNNLSIIRLLSGALAVLVFLMVALPNTVFADSECAPELSHDDCESLLHDYTRYVFNDFPDAPCGTDSTSTSGTVTADGSLPADVLANINALKPQYQQAAAATGVAWQLIAAIHYRESSNNPNLDLQAGNPIGGPYNNYASYPYGHPATLEQSMEFAARQLASLSSVGVVKQPINVPSPNPEAIKDDLYSYNGRAAVYAQQAATLGFDPATQPYEGSPYVMNNFDAIHMNMKIITTDFGSLNGVDTRFGAFTIYAKLGGASGSGSAGSCDATVGGGGVASIVEYALKYAWPDYHPPNYFIMKPEYQAAINRAVANGEYVGGLSHPGIDCGGFVTRVMRDSGADPNYNWGPNDPRQGGTSQQMAYMVAHPEKYQALGPQTSTANLQPGDIAVNDSHTFIYMGSQPNFHGSSASASVSFSGSSWRTPMADNTTFSNSESGVYYWFRLKA